MTFSIFGSLPSTKVFAQTDQQLPENMIAWYKFDEITTGSSIVLDASGNERDATVVNDAKIIELGGEKCIGLDGISQYIDLPDGIMSDLDDFTIATWINIDGGSLGRDMVDWTRIFDFGVGPEAGKIFATQNIFLDIQGAIVDVGYANRPNPDEWTHVAFTKTGNTYRAYKNGVELDRKESDKKPSDYGITTTNYIGKSNWADPYFAGGIRDFRIYNKGISGSEVSQIIIDSMSDQEAVDMDTEALSLGNISGIKEDLRLASKGNLGTQISWQSDNEDIISATGKVTRPEDADKIVRLKATITKGEASLQKTFDVLVLNQSSIQYEMIIDAKETGIDINPNLFGLFYEDINFAADGGLYAELIENRSFEFDKPLNSWEIKMENNEAGTVKVISTSPLNATNTHYAQVTVSKEGKPVGLANDGFHGLAIGKGEEYNVSFYARSEDYKGSIGISLESSKGEVYGYTEVSGITSQWEKLDCKLVSNMG